QWPGDSGPSACHCRHTVWANQTSALSHGTDWATAPARILPLTHTAPRTYTLNPHTVRGTSSPPSPTRSSSATALDYIPLDPLPWRARVSSGTPGAENPGRYPGGVVVLRSN